MDAPVSVPLDAPGEELRSRLTLVLEPGGMTIDGVWWPRSTSLAQELPALDVAIRTTLGAGIARFSYVLGDWEDSPRRVRAAGHLIKLGWFSHGDTPDSVDLSLADYRRVILKVLPPETPAADAEAFITGATVLASGRDLRPSPALEPQGPDLPAVRLGAVGVMLEELALIDDPEVRERAARRLEWRAIEWALAAGRVRWSAHAEAMATAGEPPPRARAPWS